MRNEADLHFTDTISAIAVAGFTTPAILFMYWGVDYSGTFIEAPALRWLFYLCEVGVLAYAVAIHRKHREMAGYTYTEDGLIDARNGWVHKWCDVVCFEVSHEAGKLGALKIKFAELAQPVTLRGVGELDEIRKLILRNTRNKGEVEDTKSFEFDLPHWFHQAKSIKRFRGAVSLVRLILVALAVLGICGVIVFLKPENFKDASAHIFFFITMIVLTEILFLIGVLLCLFIYLLRRAVL